MLLRIAGLGRGHLVPVQQVHGQVHSVFEHACNVALDGGGWLTLLDARCANAPRALRLDLQGGLRRLFRPGDAFAIDAGAWRTRRCHGDVAGLAVWRAAPARDVLPRQVLLANLALVDAELTAWQAAHPAGRPAPDLRLLLHELGAAIARRDTQALAAVASRLVGRGPGLTPSGDDMLTGCLCGLWRLSAGMPALRELLAAVRDTVAALLHHTTDASRHYLELALRDLFTEPLDELRRCCLEQQHGAALREACRRALAVGHSSGFDGAAGLAAACRGALAADRPPASAIATRGNTLEPAL